MSNGNTPRAPARRPRTPRQHGRQTARTLFPDLRGKIKRRDFLVGIPTIGTIAVDEHRALANFETYFNISVWFAASRPTGRMPAT